MKTNSMCAVFDNVYEYNELQPITSFRSLSTLYFAGKYRLMDFPLSSIVNANIREIFMMVNQDKIQSYLDHLGGGKEWGLDTIGSYLEINFAQEMLRKKYEGVRYFDRIINFIRNSGSAYVVYIGNKMLANVDLKAILKFHQVSGNKVTGVFKQVDRWQIAPDDQLFLFDEENKVVGNHRIREMSEQEQYNLSMNVYIADADWFVDVLDRAQMSGIVPDATERLARLMTHEHSSAYEYTGYMQNIHDVKSYFKANMDMLEKTHYDSLLNGSQKVITRIKNEVGNFYTKTSQVSQSLVSTGCKVAGYLDHVVVSRRVKIEEDTQIDHSIVISNTVIKRGAQISYAIIDKNVVVEPSVVIKGTPERPVVIRKDQVVTQDVIEGS